MRIYPLDPRIIDLAADPKELDPDAARQADRLREALDKLPANQRDAVNAVFYERISKRALARQLGCSRSEIDRRLVAAFTTLAATLDPPATLSAVNGMGPVPPTR